MFERPDWGFGTTYTFADGEAVDVVEPIPSIVVQSLGGPLPTAVTARQRVDASPHYEFVLIHEATWLSGTESFPDRLRLIGPRTRFVLCDSALAAGLSRPGALPKSDFIIEGATDELGIIAEALIMALTGRLLICVDFADIATVAGKRAGSVARGRAFVVEGRGDTRSADKVRTKLQAAANDGFDGGVLLVVMAAAPYAPDLAGLDAFYATALAGAEGAPTVVTATLDGSETGIVAMRFPSFEPLHRIVGT